MRLIEEGKERHRVQSVLYVICKFAEKNVHLEKNVSEPSLLAL